MANINASVKMERKWANGSCTAMAAVGQIFGKSRPGSVPAWAPDSAAPSRRRAADLSSSALNLSRGGS
eukprot:7143037-Pyramimonas_sp.AAC.1